MGLWTNTDKDGNTRIRYETLIGIVVLVVVLFGCVAFVGAGERGVLLTWGAVDGRVLQPGINAVIPFANSVAYMNVQTQKIEHGAEAASKDLQIVTTTVALNYHLKTDAVTTLYRDVGREYSARIIDPAIQESVKAATAGYTAEELITKRELVKLDIKSHLTNRLAVYNIQVEDISITNFDFSAEFNKQIEAKVTALQRALTEENNLKAVEYQAKQKIAQAEGEAAATLKKAQAEAQAIQITGEALKENPKLIDLEAVKKWDGKLPVFTGGNVPLIDVSNLLATP